jgi:hypothetical protein
LAIENDVLTRLVVHLRGIEHQPVDVVRERLERFDTELLGLLRNAAAQDLLVVVDQLDLEVGLGVGAA